MSLVKLCFTMLTPEPEKFWVGVLEAGRIADALSQKRAQQGRSTVYISIIMLSL
jgi:hypothetical protein